LISAKDLYGADVRSRAAMALISYGTQGAALSGIGFPKLMP
jgi:hypothetical protein